MLRFQNHCHALRVDRFRDRFADLPSQPLLDLQPTRKHHAVERFVEPQEFEAFARIAYTKGFLMVASSPLTRSSHHAGEDFAKLRAARAAKYR